MKKIILSLSLVLFVQFIFAQDYPELHLKQSEVESHIRFLASDELQGRRTGSEGNNTAARYIAEEIRSLGYTYAPGLDSYYQMIPFENILPPQDGRLQMGDQSFTYGEEYIFLSGDAADLSGDVVFANHGWVDEEKGIDDYKDLDIEGKIVVVLPGEPDSKEPLAVFQAMSKKRKIAAEKGAIALIELYQLQFPWPFFKRYFSGERLGVKKEEAGNASGKIIYGWINANLTDILEKAKAGDKVAGSVRSTGTEKTDVSSQNVVGLLEGSDPNLKNEYVLMTAHYDHVGVGKQGGGPFTERDSIFNGTRDNAMGTTAILTAAKAFAEMKPKRSIIFLAVTGEELGLLGSEYYADNPLIPLDQVIFNMNTDGAGYNDVSSVSSIGYGRTGTDEAIETASKAFGLGVIQNPAPEQGLFDRSDNVSFAKRGVPCVTLSPGMTTFDQEIGKYYHQVADNPESLDYAYATKYCQTFIHAARLIADAEQRPVWVEGDKYEEVGKELYGKE